MSPNSESMAAVACESKLTKDYKKMMKNLTIIYKAKK